MRAVDRQIPGFYNSLDGSLAQAWAMLERGAIDRRSAFHSPVVSTVDERGHPMSRIMVLRRASAHNRTLAFHTDIRSSKISHIGRSERASVLAYDPDHKIQVRLGATARVHHDDLVASAGWVRAQPQSRLCYEQPVAPGTPVEVPLDAPPVDQRFALGDDGAVNFAVLILEAQWIEWLYLAVEGHRRAHWTWDGKDWRGTWLAP